MDASPDNAENSTSSRKKKKHKSKDAVSIHYNNLTAVSFVDLMKFGV